MKIFGHAIRFIVAAFVLLFVGFIVPAFTIGGFWNALLLALVIALIGWVAESIFDRRITPFGRGITGFLASAAIIWLAQFLIEGVNVTIIGAILAALVIGIIDLFIPISTPLANDRKR